MSKNDRPDVYQVKIDGRELYMGSDEVHSYQIFKLTSTILYHLKASAIIAKFAYKEGNAPALLVLQEEWKNGEVI